MRRFLAVLAAASLAACSSDKSTAPSVFNINVGTPSGWFLVGQNSIAYTVGIDHITTHSGSGALHIASIDSSPLLFRGVGQYILANSYRGKRLRLSGWVRHLNLGGSTAGLWMRVDGNFETLGFDNFSTRPLRGTSDWHQVDIILDVPDDAIGIEFGALMSARGDLVVDDLRLDVINANGPTTNQLTGPQATSFDAATFYATSVGPRIAANMGFDQ
jgi:hypothetical protein